MSEIFSPCKNICKLVIRKSNKEEYCIGCGRTVEEITNWKNASNSYKLKVLKRLEL